MSINKINEEIEYVKRNDCLCTADKKKLIAELEYEKRQMALVHDGDISDFENEC